MDQQAERTWGHAALELLEAPETARAESGGRAPAVYGVQVPSAAAYKFKRHGDASVPPTTVDLATGQAGDDVYSFSTRSERVAQACSGLGLGLLLVLVAVALHGFFVLAIGSALCLVQWARTRLCRPYEVRLAPSGELRFVRVMGTTQFHTADIRRIVRVKRRSNGALHKVRIEHTAGSVTLDGHWYISWRISQLRPGTPVTTEEWDDTD
jgi:hypothetical protein